jgi:hypothetical protein
MQQTGMYYGQGPPPSSVFSIDVECVASGPDHNSRVVGQIALVVSEERANCARMLYSIQTPAKTQLNLLALLQDQYERVLLNIYVKPDRAIVSYLTPLTG